MLKDFLDEKAAQYEQPIFIEDDPIGVVHQFSKPQDIEIMGLWTSVLAWGRRSQIIKSSLTLATLMDNSPHDFIKNHQESDRKRFLNFKHRTFQPEDALYFLEFLQHYYLQYDSLEEAFLIGILPGDETVEAGLIAFQRQFFSLENALKRTEKHLPSPIKNASCKRVNMFLRWMVRSSEKGVDFGIWKKIKPAQLLIPLDVHVERVARRLGLLNRKQTDWKAVLELTAALRQLDAQDPVKYDFALFGMGVQEKDPLK